jgi:hypothetical protein
MNLLSIGMVAGLAATLGAAALKHPTATLGAAPADRLGASALPEPDTVFRLETPGGRLHCTVRRGRTLSDGRAVLLPGPRCAAVFAPLDEATVWRDGEDGTVDFIGKGGRTVVRFALADGAGYESIRPRSKIFSLIVER